MSTYSIEKEVKLNLVDGLYNETIKANNSVKIVIEGIFIATLLVNGDVCFAEHTQKPLLSPVDDNVCQYSEITNASSFLYDGHTRKFKLVSENTFNLLNFNNIIESFDSHKGNCATDQLREKFNDMAMAMSVLPYNETLARYSVVNKVNTLLLTFNNGLELNVTQSIEQEEVAFSIHHNGVMLFVGSSSPADLAKKMLQVIYEPVSFEDGLS